MTSTRPTPETVHMDGWIDDRLYRPTAAPRGGRACRLMERPPLPAMVSLARTPFNLRPLPQVGEVVGHAAVGERPPLRLVDALELLDEPVGQGSGLMVSADEITYAVELGPVWNVSDSGRGVLCEGPVGSSRLGRLSAFR
jgi:hypothetical protein